MHIFVRLFLCAALFGSLGGCSSSNRPNGQSGDRDAAIDGGGAGKDAGDPSKPPKAGSGGSDPAKPPKAGTDEPEPPTEPAGPTSISPSGGSAVGQSDNYRLKVVVGAPAPMNEGASDNFKLRIGARLQ